MLDDMEDLMALLDAEMPPTDLELLKTTASTSTSAEEVETILSAEPKSNSSVNMDKELISATSLEIESSELISMETPPATSLEIESSELISLETPSSTSLERESSELISLETKPTAQVEPCPAKESPPLQTISKRFVTLGGSSLFGTPTPPSKEEISEEEEDVEQPEQAEIHEEKEAQGPQHAQFVPWRPKHAKAITQNDLIFIAIASYRDTELLPTIRDLLNKARYPEKLRFGICLQDTLLAMNAFPYYSDPRFRVLRVPASQSKGCCWARSKMQSLQRDERYYFQIDSHHRFVQDWDDLAVRLLHMCPSSKPILSSYLPPYKPETAESDVQNSYAVSIAMQGFTKKGLVRIQPHRMEGDRLVRPQLAFMIAAGFIFTFGDWVKQVPYDPSLYFNGEEVSLAIRSWTHGWDIYAPHIALSWHYYERKDCPKHWTDHKDDWRVTNEVSIERVLAQIRGDFQGERSLDAENPYGAERVPPYGAERVPPYGLGVLRTLAEYEAFAGIQFARKAVAPTAKKGLVRKDVRNGTQAPPPPEVRSRAWHGASVQSSDPKRAPESESTYNARARDVLSSPPKAVHTGKKSEPPRAVPKFNAKETLSARRHSLFPTSVKGKQPDNARRNVVLAKKPTTLVSTNSVIRSAPAMQAPPLRGTQMPMAPPMFREVNRLADELMPAGSPMELFAEEKLANERSRIDYHAGYFVKEDNVWHEVKRGKRTATFRQRNVEDRTLLVLYDASRALHLRINSKGVCEAAQGSWGPQLAWRKFFTGKWTA